MSIYKKRRKYLRETGFPESAFNTADIMKYIFTGGAGFIGSHIVEGLAGQKHDVLILDNLFSGKRENISPYAISKLTGEHYLRVFSFILYTSGLFESDRNTNN